MLVKYGSYYGGYLVLGMPVFGPKSKKYLKQIGGDKSKIAGDYVRNTSLLINLSKAIGKFIISYKELQNLAGYTTLMDELEIVLNDLKEGKYQRRMINPDLVKERGILNHDDDKLVMNKVPILAPNGDILIKEVSFELEKGMHLMVDGPNGCGKSSVFRIMGELWPLFAGSISKPKKAASIFYVPQVAYLPKGSLRDQIIYPDRKMEMLKKRINDKKLLEILKILKLDYIVEREGGLNIERNWTDVLSGGEKQRMAIARLYSCPILAEYMATFSSTGITGNCCRTPAAASAESSFLARITTLNTSCNTMTGTMISPSIGISSYDRPVFSCCPIFRLDKWVFTLAKALELRAIKLMFSHFLLLAPDVLCLQIHRADRFCQTVWIHYHPVDPIRL